MTILRTTRTLVGLAIGLCVVGCRGSALNPKSDLELRRDAAERISTPAARDTAVANVVMSGAEQGDGRFVMQSLPRILDPKMRDATAEKASDELVKAGQRNAANDVARTIEDRGRRDAVMTRLALSPTYSDPAMDRRAPSAADR